MFWMLAAFIIGFIGGAEYGERQPIECVSIGWPTPQEQTMELWEMMQNDPKLCEGINETGNN